MKAFLILVVTALFFSLATFFYLYLYDALIIAFGKLVTFVAIVLVVYCYISLLYAIDNSKKIL